MVDRPCHTCISRGFPEKCVEGYRKLSKYLIDSQEETNMYDLELESALSGMAIGVFILDHEETHRFDSLMLNSEYKLLGNIVDLHKLSLGYHSDTSSRKKASTPSLSDIEFYDWRVSKSSLNEDIYKRKIDPFPYFRSNHSLMIFGETFLSEQDFITLCSYLSRFGPSVLDSLRNLSYEDLQFMERNFQRHLIESSSLFSMSGTPAAMWRRSGELASLNREFCFISGWPSESLLRKPLCIYELLDSGSMLEYWRKFGDSICEALSSSFSMKIKLLKYAQGLPFSPYLDCGRYVDCMLWVTIKRDVFDIPVCIYGHFLPSF